ncbi:TVP38/TMEM64 family protein [Leptolyngbya sp. FACHB-36]|uniref:TVP38/TMEM64 family protein n=1 Tax=Leptolyngbya sp. FACHB-36 TaxID=2692808 RepID=UPI0018F0208E|nr:TVP38/TMEM64 family protein [Leptolyngbya sp. FACHB-36]
MLLGIGIVVVLVTTAQALNLQGLLQRLLLWVQGLGPSGAIAFIGIYVLATILFLPGSILTLGGGVLFGIGLGSVCVFVGAVIGAMLAFLIGRYLARGWVAKQLEGKVQFQAIDQAVAREGLKIVLLTRLSPIFPFNLLNYAFGVTQVSLRDYVLGSIGMLPGTVIYVYIGSLAGNFASLGTETTAPPQLLQWLIRGVGLIAAVAVSFYITRIARKALEQSL